MIVRRVERQSSILKKSSAADTYLTTKTSRLDWAVGGLFGKHLQLFDAEGAWLNSVMLSHSLRDTKVHGTKPNSDGLLVANPRRGSNERQKSRLAGVLPILGLINNLADDAVDQSAVSNKNGFQRGRVARLHKQREQFHVWLTIASHSVFAK